MLTFDGAGAVLAGVCGSDERSSILIDGFLGPFEVLLAGALDDADCSRLGARWGVSSGIGELWMCLLANGAVLARSRGFE